MDADDVNAVLMGTTDAEIAALWPAVLKLIMDTHRCAFPTDRLDVARFVNAPSSSAGGSAPSTLPTSSASSSPTAQSAPLVDVYAVHVQRFLGLRSILARAGFPAKKEDLRHARWYRRSASSLPGNFKLSFPVVYVVGWVMHAWHLQCQGGWVVDVAGARD